MTKTDPSCSGRFPYSHIHNSQRARRVPAEEEDDAVSAVSELEWLEEQGAGAEEPGAGEPPLFLPTPDFMASAGKE